jgi:short-subunit dehydrogenase
LQDQVRQNLDLNCCAATIRRSLHRLEYVWKRPRYVLAPDPQCEKKSRIRCVLGNLPKRSVSDLAEEGAANALADKVLNQGIDIDYLVNNGGRGSYGMFSESTLDDELSMMRLNMESLIVLIKRFLPGIVTRKEKILNLASTASFQPGPYMAVYFATKSFVLSFSEAQEGTIKQQ